MEASLDRSMFRRIVNCLGIRVLKQDVGSVRKLLGNRVFTQPKLKCVIANDDDHKIILVSPALQESDLTPLVSQLSFFEFTPQEICVEYEHQNAEEILKKLLPPDVEVPSSFETIGHIAHLNLRPEHEPFKHRIGQVFLDKSRTYLRTVVNKTGKIETQFRTFPMELLAGDLDFVVDTKCNGLRFQFDFSKVYWNTKLSEEHERLTSKYFKEGHIVVDAFCGVGPFALRAARTKCIVLANDLNPESVHSLENNVRLNKFSLATATTIGQAGSVAVFNQDARLFLSHTVWQHTSTVHHVVMNLPETSISFLNAIPAQKNSDNTRMMVHCYCFSNGETDSDRVSDVLSRMEEVLQHKVVESTIYTVRDVAPKKFMMCATFPFPLMPDQGDDVVPLSKRGRVGEE